MHRPLSFFSNINRRPKKLQFDRALRMKLLNALAWALGACNAPSRATREWRGDSTVSAKLNITLRGGSTCVRLCVSRVIRIPVHYNYIGPRHDSTLARPSLIRNNSYRINKSCRRSTRSSKFKATSLPLEILRRKMETLPRCHCGQYNYTVSIIFITN